MFNMDKIFSKKPRQEDAIEIQNTIVEESVQEIEPEKSLEYYEEKKQELKELYTERSGEAVKYQNKKDRINNIGPDELLNSKLTTQAHDSTLGGINEKIKEISDEGIGLTKQEHYEAREKMLQDELVRVNEKIEDFKQKEIYPGNESAQRLLSLKETVNGIWNKDISDEKGYEILKEIYGDNNVYERTYTKPSKISSKEVIEGLDNALGKITDEYSKDTSLKAVEYRDLFARKHKIQETIYNWDRQNNRNHVE